MKFKLFLLFFFSKFCYTLNRKEEDKNEEKNHKNKYPPNQLSCSGGGGVI